MKRKISRVPPVAPKQDTVVPFLEQRAQQPANGDGRPGQMFMFRLRNGFVGQVSISEKEADRLWLAVQAPDEFHFIVVFDSFERRIALNLRYVVASQFDFIGESGLSGGLWIDDGAAVDIYFADSHKPLSLEIEADHVSVIEFDEGGMADNELCQLDNLFYYLNSAHNGSDDVQRLRDVDGAVIWLRINEIALATVPLALLAEPPKEQPKKKARQAHT